MVGRLKPRVAVVGGGWAGLAAALRLAEAGIPVSMHEAARQLGGRARTVDWHGVKIDNGQHLLSGAYTETLALIDRLGTASGLERHALRLAGPDLDLVVPRWPAPLHLLAGLVGARGLDTADKRAALRLMAGLRLRRFKLPRDQDAAHWLRACRQPDTTIHRLWEPICVAALNTPLAMASAQVFCHVLRDSLAGRRAASDLLFNRTDLGALLAEPAAARLTRLGAQVHRSSRIEGIVLDSRGFRLQGPDETVDQVIVATHASQVRALLKDLPESDAWTRPLAEFTWQPILTLWLRFAAPVRLPYPMVALGEGADPWLFERSDIAPGLAALVASAEGTHLGLDTDALLAAWLPRLAARLGPLPTLLDALRIVEKRATWACVPDMTRPTPAGPVPGLYLAGDYTAGDYPATLEGAVRSGLQCASLILDRP